MQGGYESNFGVIFQGNIKQVLVGRESATDTFIDIVAGDGDLSYNFAIVNQTLAGGSKQLDQIAAAAGAMKNKGGETLAPVTNLPTQQLPRGKVMYGSAKNYLRNVGKNVNQSWSIQNGQVVVLPVKGYLPGEAVELTSKNRYDWNTPQQTNVGVNIKCLMNPRLKVGGRVHINNKSIAGFKINLEQPGSPANLAPPLAADGYYYIWTIGHEGDTRANDPWFTNLICITTSVSANPLNATITTYSG